MLFYECETAEIGLGTEFSVDLFRVGLVGGQAQARVSFDLPRDKVSYLGECFRFERSIAFQNLFVACIPVTAVDSNPIPPNKPEQVPMIGDGMNHEDVPTSPTIAFSFEELSLFGSQVGLIGYRRGRTFALAPSRSAFDQSSSQFLPLGGIDRK
jgi:hypothetical protein